MPFGLMYTVIPAQVLVRRWIIRPHRIYRTCGLLLHMSHVPWSVCLFACVFGTPVSLAETDKTFEILRQQTHVGP